MTRKIEREKFQCSRCSLIMWSEEAIQKHIEKSSHKKAKINRFSEPELCPFVIDVEKVICSCNPCISILENGQPLCPSLFYHPELLERYRFMDIQSGIYIGKIDAFEVVGNRVKILLTTNGKQCLLNGPKTVAFEIMKRSVSNELSKYSNDIEGSQKVWNGFQFIIERPEKLRNILDKVVELGYTFSFEVRQNGIIGEVRRVDS